MDLTKTRSIIDSYKANFSEIHLQEIYKWQAIKSFQDNWDMNAADFSSMLPRALHPSRNLLGSGNYFARRMLEQNARRNPEAIRSLFLSLYNEDQDLFERIIFFRNEFKKLNDVNFPGDGHYQDDRALLVYLSLKFPDRYYLYKFTMFKTFVSLVDFPFEPIKGRLENVAHYLTLCNLLRDEIIRDQELLSLHKTRIGPNEFHDESSHVLTQDVIYAATFHLPRFAAINPERKLFSLSKASLKLRPRKHNIVLKSSRTNYLERERENKILGDHGESLVFEYEVEKLKRIGSKKVPKIVSREGDGLGYDILSYDEDGNEKYIEVKTTTSGFNHPFFVTANELYLSQNHSDRFVLYRLYNFDPVERTADYFEISGDLTDLCINPMQYKVIVEDIEKKTFSLD